MNILITGASKGIGFELVKQFAKIEGNKVVALSRDAVLLEKLKKYCEQKFGIIIYTYSIDFLTSDLEKELKYIFKNHNHHFDIVINNAGYLVNQPFNKISKEEILKTFQTNLFAPIQIIQEMLTILDEKKRCHIINIGSMGGFQGSSKFSGLSIYSSSKAALANLTECLAEEYKEHNIKVNCLALGSVQTEMLNQAFPDFKAQTSASDMAKYIIQFATQEPICFNGKVIPVSSTTP